MDHQSTMTCCPVFEFPFLGHQTNSIASCIDQLNASLVNTKSPSGGMCCCQLPASVLNCIPQTDMIPCNSNTSNTTVYNVPENMPIESILQRFGVDMTSLQKGGSVPYSCPNLCPPIDICFEPPKCRRRRIVCREVSDSEEDEYCKRRLQRRGQSKDVKHEPDSSKVSPPPSIHNVLSRVWDKAKEASEALPRSNSEPNIPRLWETMKNTPPQNTADIARIWSTMRDAPRQNNPNMAGMWEAMRNAPPQNNPNMAGMWEAMRNAPPQNNRNMAGMWEAMRNAPPQTNPNLAGMWEAMRNAPPQTNPNIAGMWEAMRNAPQQNNPNMAGMWEAMRNAPPSPTPYQQNAVSNNWHQANYAAKQADLSKQYQMMLQGVRENPQGMSSQPSPVNAAWRQLQAATMPPTSPNSMRNSPSRVPPPTSFAAVLSQAHRQQSPMVSGW